MPPRVPLFQCLNTIQTRSVSYPRSFTSTAYAQASNVTQKRKHKDPYAIAQARAKKAANLSRQEVLKKERAESLGDPVRGVETDYVRSFDDLTLLSEQSPSAAVQTRIEATPIQAAQEISEHSADDTTVHHRNFFWKEGELEAGLQRSRSLATPTRPTEERIAENFTTDTTPAEDAAHIEARNDTATEALRRIASLSLGSSKDRMRVIKQRCIADFGRHNTDKFLQPKPAPAWGRGGDEKTPSAGPDTGSSEVQIAILTAKIRTLAEFLQTRGSQDKMNKRNLRLLVHRRQKLLKYLHRKERGGPRWQNVIETLGLTEGTWRGEISM